MSNYCSKCGEPTDGIELVLTTSDGTVIASLNEEQSKIFLDVAVHHLLDTIIAPKARRVAAAHGEP